MSEQNTVAIPGTTLSIKLGTPVPLQSKVNFTSTAEVPKFETIKHLLSDKPLRAAKARKN